MLKGNKGEWSELYAFFKLLSDKKIFAADQDLQKIDGVFFPILKIIREESRCVHEYELCDDDVVKIKYPDENSVIIDCDNLKNEVRQLFDNINNSSKTFSIPIANNLIERFDVNCLNAGNSKKEDLVLKIHDYTIGRDNEVGFSIKSRLGSPATLLNASSATNFIYKIVGLKEADIERINSINTKSKIRDRLFEICNTGGLFEFHGVDSEIFERNLRKIDTVMPEILAAILLSYFLNKGTTFPELIEYIRENDVRILNFDLSSEDFEYKIKSLLNDAALGMVPASIWDGSLRAHGGVIIVKEDGEIVCYHLYNASAFKDYLFRNTRFESPSTTRHKYGFIYKEGGDMYIKLNLQIRFTK
ncbi:MAG: HpaII family restriction endonuclease [Patescibacteria group bacterium]